MIRFPAAVEEQKGNVSSAEEPLGGGTGREEAGGREEEGK